jgi:hypothetical protein
VAEAVGRSGGGGEGRLWRLRKNVYLAPKSCRETKRCVTVGEGSREKSQRLL